MIILTARQHQILELIVRLYANLEAPIGSKTLLKESFLDISPATVRNEMVVLEKNGFLVKAHTSSGRIPSYEGYRYYVDRLITKIENDSWEQSYEADLKAVSEIFLNRRQENFKMAKIAADLLVSLTGLPCLVFGQNNEEHRVADFKLVLLSNHQIMAILLSDQGHVENKMFQTLYPVEDDDLRQMRSILNSELRGITLEDAYQRTKLTIPMIMQRQLSTSIDFSPLVEKSIQQVKGTRYFVSGKNNLFDCLDQRYSNNEYKKLFNLIDGSNELFDLFEQRQDGIEVLFGQEFAPQGMRHLSLVTGTFTQDLSKMSLSILGPSTMHYSRMIVLMEQILKEFNQ
ncbi:heat-inducible transcriptional repressor HrcA [Facklamia sp. P12945]|uniref:heat-inducible transcriptional repressor HrcA n=1 Tax=unclassified Facklamia TaxID=2622293 RepID=UPI003D17D15B